MLPNEKSSPMQKTKSVAQFFNDITDTFLDLYQSQYINFGYWENSIYDVAEAQEALVKKFGDFSLLKKDLDLIDLGFGTGEQDLFYYRQYQCKSILGLNISEHQIALANKKLEMSPKLKQVIKFCYGDATKLNEVQSDPVDRILALESAQLFPNKKAFLKGSWDKLKKGGYLCLAEPIFNHADVFNPEHYISIKKEIPSTLRRSNYFNSLLHEQLLFFLEKEQQDQSSKEQNSIFYRDYLNLFEMQGFKVDAVEDISKQVLPFYEVFKRPVLERIKNINNEETYFLIYWLAIIYFRYGSFLQGHAGYYLIRLKKE